MVGALLRTPPALAFGAGTLLALGLEQGFLHFLGAGLSLARLDLARTSLETGIGVLCATWCGLVRARQATRLLHRVTAQTGDVPALVGQSAGQVGLRFGRLLDFVARA